MIYTIERYNDLYSVDEIGNVYGYGGSILKVGDNGAGYKCVNIYCNGISKKEYVHRLVYEAISGKEIPKGYEINHKDGNRSNNKITNLELVTRSENLKHSYCELGRQPNKPFGKNVGGDNGNSRAIYQEGYGLIFDSISEAATFFNEKYSTLKAQVCGQNPNKYNLKYI